MSTSINQTSPTAVMSPAQDQMSQAEMNTEYNIHLDRWRAMQYGTTCVKAVFADDIGFRLTNQIGNFVCLGLGKFSERPTVANNMLYRYSNPGLEQLGFVTLMLELLGKDHKVKVYFQDPKFGEAEVTFLEDLGYGVLDHPDAISKVDAGTLLFAPRVPSWVTAEALASSSPAVYIANDIDTTLRKLKTTVFFPKRDNSASQVILTKYRDAVSVKPMQDYSEWTSATATHWIHTDPKEPNSPDPGMLAELLTKRKGTARPRMRDARGRFVASKPRGRSGKPSAGKVKKGRAKRTKAGRG